MQPAQKKNVLYELHLTHTVVQFVSRAKPLDDPVQMYAFTCLLKPPRKSNGLHLL